MNVNEIKIELFDKCHELVYEYMKDKDQFVLDTSEEEFHNLHGRMMQRIFKRLAEGKIN